MAATDPPAVRPAMAGSRWELYPHGADIGVRGIGPTMETAFEQIALALTAAVTDPKEVRRRERIDVALEEIDPELLLVKWLNAVVLEMAIRGMLFGRFSVRINGGKLQAEIWGERVNVPRHDPAVEVKGATLTDLKVGQQPDGYWIAQCIIDV
jgi:tRNA nucleotidyltransferase (CCA-adding enzyme)